MFRIASVVATTLFIVLILMSSVRAQNPNQEQIDKWIEYDSLNPPAADPILVVGDSAIRFWESLTRDFADYEILQRGFGGARLTDLSYFVNDVVLRYDPLAIVTDAGLNDYRHDSATSSQIFNRYVEFVDLVHTGQDQSRPPIPILHIGLMPTIGHADVWDSIVLPANSLISNYAAGDDSLYYLDVAQPMLATAPGPGQPPSADLFITDGVHLTASGYTIWSDVLRNGLETASLAAKIPTSNPLHPAVGSRILIDFGPDDPVHGGQTINPDVNGNHWNNWHSVPGNDNPAAGGPVILDGESLGNLLTDQGNETGIDLIVTGEMAAAGKSSGGLLNPDSALLGDLAIATATEDYFFARGIDYLGGLQSGGFMLTGLDPALAYNLKIFGSNTASEFRTTDYVVHGAGDPRTVSLLTSGSNIGSDGDYDGNDDQTVNANAIRSDEYGQVFVDFLADGSYETYLNAMEITIVAKCDFDGDGSCDLFDVDMLIAEIAAETHDPHFDLTGDETVDVTDRDEWLTQAGAINLASGNSYLLADFNLDGTVDGTDLLIWNSNKFSATGRWSLGDVNGDGTTDGLDYLDWKLNKFMSSDGIDGVPEPGINVLLVATFTFGLFAARRLSRGQTPQMGRRRYPMRRWSITAMTLALFVLMPSKVGAITFGEWATSRGYSPGDSMPATLDASDAFIDSLDGIEDYDWTHTTQLNLSNNQLTSIATGSFVGLTNVHSLHLNDNLISTVEAGAFDGPINLNDLYLNENQIATIEAGTFDRLTEVNNLWLGGNQLSSVPSGLFDAMPLSILYLNENAISSIEPGLFAGQGDLFFLELSANHMTAIDPEVFDGLSNLRVLHVTENRFASVDSVPLSALPPTLEALGLDGNQLTTIESNAFAGLLHLVRLRELGLSGNPLTTLESNAFRKLELTRLNLERTQLTTLQADALSGLTVEFMLFGDNVALSELNFPADFRVAHGFDLEGNLALRAVSLKNAPLKYFWTVFDGGIEPTIAPHVRLLTGVSEVPGITELDLSGSDFVGMTDLSLLYPMDDLTDLWLVGTKNLDAVQLDELLDELDAMQAIEVEGVLYMTQVDYDALNAAGGGLLEAWHYEQGHHVTIIPEPSTFILSLVSILVGVLHRH